MRLIYVKGSSVKDLTYKVTIRLEKLYNCTKYHYYVTPVGAPIVYAEELLQTLEVHRTTIESNDGRRDDQ